ncbi:MAG: TIM barrel protein [SAR202 cluster bacterium]|jgi:sugar phosphate isomerase/epimerase|nr:TIM barrel protein [SAR202 cluster bacterium]MDP6514371.1 TIM barrel protein [SAR202 cluster bacterium]
MKIGAITNSWGVQIDGGNLPDLVRDVRDRGSKHIELRQTFLGNCETGSGDDWRPVIGNMQSLVDGFPDLSFNLAMAVPCLSGGVDPKGEQFQQSLEAAKVVGRDAPHLRLVDPTPQDKVWESFSDIPEEALSVAGLAREAASQGITLSVENSGQSIGAITLLVEKCRQQLTEEEGKLLGVCPDPTNQIRRQPDTDALADLEAMPLDMMKIVHFKQSIDDEAIPTVDDGDLDCARMAQILDAKGYTGPAIFEIPSHENAFENSPRASHTWRGSRHLVNLSMAFDGYQSR